MSENKILTIPQAAEKLQVSPTWVYRQCKAGHIPHVRISGLIRIQESDLENWLSRQMKRAEKGAARAA